MKTLILGGARSGKSLYAESLVTEPCLYIATARPYKEPLQSHQDNAAEFDPDFYNRIRIHQERRPSQWDTEDKNDLIAVLNSQAITHYSTVIVDDLGTWLTHHMDTAGAWDLSVTQDAKTHLQQGAHALINAIENLPPTVELIIVSPEVGMGIIPESHAGRIFRDYIGNLNQQVAAAVDRVVFVVAGQPLTIKDDMN